MTSSRRPAVRDKQYLYECAVQGAEADLDFVEKVYRRQHGRLPRILKEDFCGTAVLACTWVKRRPENRAVGVDLHRPTLQWGIEHNVKVLGDAAARLSLRQDDVRAVTRPRVDVTVALNFSYWIFRPRAEMLRYFKAARAGLAEGGMFIVDLFGGSEAMVVNEERRRIEASVTFDGTRVPAFTYFWDQQTFNPIDNHFICHIHFQLRDGTRMRRAFSYDWRFWTLAEIRELLQEAGFAAVDVYTDDWDDALGESNGIYRKRTRFDPEGVWLGYAVAHR